MEVDEIVEKIINFLEEKAELDKQDSFIIAKKLEEVCWDRLNEEDYQDEEELDDIPDDDVPDTIDELKIPEKPKVIEKSIISEKDIDDGDF